MFAKLIPRFALKKPDQPRLPAGCRLYAIGDLHGRADLLNAAFRAIAVDDAGRSPAPRRLIVLLGDFVDRGPAVPALIDGLLAGPPPGFELVVLRGNHETMLVAFLGDPMAGGDWLEWGGTATLGAYGVAPPIGAPTPARLGLVQAAFAAALPAAHRALLERLPARFELGDYLFVHAGVRPGVALDAQRPEDLTAIREPFLSSRQWHGRMIVHGHHPVDWPERLPNRIGIDTNAWATGRLAVLRLEADEHQILAVRADA